MDYRQLLRMMSAGRVVIGVALLLTPSRAGRGWIGYTAVQPGARVILRAVGGRDLVLGLGGLRALSTGSETRHWAQAAMIADAADATATLLAFRHLPARGRWLALLIAGGAAIAGAKAITDLDEPASSLPSSPPLTSR